MKYLYNHPSEMVMVEAVISSMNPLLDKMYKQFNNLKMKDYSKNACTCTHTHTFIYIYIYIYIKIKGKPGKV